MPKTTGQQFFLLRSTLLRALASYSSDLSHPQSEPTFLLPPDIHFFIPTLPPHGQLQRYLSNRPSAYTVTPQLFFLLIYREHCLQGSQAPSGDRTRRTISAQFFPPLIFLTRNTIGFDVVFLDFIIPFRALARFSLACYLFVFVVFLKYGQLEA